MFIIKNSIKNIYRYRSRYILPGIVLFIIVVIASVLIGVFNYSSMTTEALKAKYAGTVQISKDDRNIATFSKEAFLLFNDCEYVNRVKFNSYIISSVSMGQIKYDITDEHKKFYSEDEYKALKKQNEVVETELSINGETLKLRNLNLNPVYIMGYEYDNLPDEKKARFALKSGRMYEDSGECIIAVNDKISDEEWNLLGIGDIITIRVKNGIEKEYTVTGILQSDESITADTKTRVLFTTFDSAETFKNAAQTTDSQNTTGAVNNPIEPDMGTRTSNVNAINEVIERYDVEAELKSYEYFYDFQDYVRGLEGYSSSPLYENFISILNLLNQSFYWSILFIVIIAMILIFVTILTTMIQLNSRKYEIAVLRSVGMKKRRLVLNYLIENLTFVWSITIVGLTAARFIEPIFIKNVFKGIRDMLSPEIFEALTQNTGFSLLLLNIGIVFGGMTVIVMLSLILTCVNIVRFEPLKIFNNQY